MSIILKSGSSGNLLNVNADGTLPVSIENTPSVASLDKTVTGIISNPDIVVPAPGGVGQMVSGNSTTGSFLAIQTTGLSSWSLSVTGGAFSTTFYFEGSIDTTDGLDGHWVSLFGRLMGNSGNENAQSFTAGNQMFEGTCGPLQFVRLRSVGGTITTPPTVVLQAGAVSTISIGTPLPTGDNVIGHVVVDSGSVSGTVTANIGTTGGLALDATLTGGTQKSKIVDAAGANQASVSAAGALKVDGSAVTQPVSLAVAPTTPVTGTFFQATQPVSVAALPLPAGAATSANQPVPVVKNTQGATATPTQDLKDSGRTSIMLYATGVASGATGVETAVTLTKSAGTAATAAAVSFVVTSGKTFRITSFIFAVRGNATATAQISTFSLRLNTAGAVTTASTPILLQARAATPATASAYDRVTAYDEYEIQGTGTLQIGVTANAVFVTNAPTWDVWLIGYEY